MIQQSEQLQDIIDIHELERILEQFCKASKMITIASDFRGNMLTSEKNTTYYTPFCKKMRLTGCPLEAYCKRSDALGSLEAAQRGEPFIYRCHMGFVEVAAPIIVNNMYLGAILMGQVRTDPEIMETLPQVFKSDLDLLGYPELKEFYKESYANSSFIPYPQLKAFGALMSHVANYIVQNALNYTMRAQLTNMRIQHLEEQNRATNLEKDLAFMRLKNLKMRIHPHYLFNTLNVINGLAVLEDAPQTSQAIAALSETLRFSLKRQEKLIPLREEMECVESYTSIQKLFFKNRVEFLFQVDKNCLDALVPLYTIQILVENACLHGFTNTVSNGRFTLTVLQNAGFINIEASDNGSGIDDEVAQQLNNLSPDPARDTPNSGLQSLLSNLRYYYGTEAYWQVSQLPSGGTSIVLRLPIRHSSQDTSLRDTVSPDTPHQDTASQEMSSQDTPSRKLGS
ncbi:Probable sensor-like histidine kinase YehU [uncultured Clostridium sp.]|nr:Probable sensor-like histidine kinase YehU [uncultured Clostridium sp.]